MEINQFFFQVLNVCLKKKIAKKLLRFHLPVKFHLLSSSTDSSKGTLLNTVRANTVTFQNSFYCRAPRTWNTLPSHLRNIDCSVGHFKKELFNHYLYLTKTVYDVDTPQTYKSVCIKYHTNRPLASLLERMCC